MMVGSKFVGQLRYGFLSTLGGCEELRALNSIRCNFGFFPVRVYVLESCSDLFLSHSLRVDR